MVGAPRGDLAISGDTTGISWVEAGDAVTHPIAPRTGPMANHPNLNGMGGRKGAGGFPTPSEHPCSLAGPGSLAWCMEGAGA